MDTIIKVSDVVRRHITNPHGGRNITEWCKKEQCWEELIAIDIKLSDEMDWELIQTYGKERTKVDRGIDSPASEDHEKILEVVKVQQRPGLRFPDRLKRQETFNHCKEASLFP